MPFRPRHPDTSHGSRFPGCQLDLRFLAHDSVADARDRRATPWNDRHADHDIRELFKVRVTGIVVVDRLGRLLPRLHAVGNLHSQRGLIDTLLGIGLVSCRRSALNQALERSTDARMRRTADRPLASGRISPSPTESSAASAHSPSARCRSHAVHQPAHRLPCPAHRGHATSPSTRRSSAHTTLATFIGAFPGALPRCSAGPLRAASSSGRRSPSSPSSSSGSSRTSWPSPGSIRPPLQPVDVAGGTATSPTDELLLLRRYRLAPPR